MRNTSGDGWQFGGLRDFPLKHQWVLVALCANPSRTVRNSVSPRLALRQPELCHRKQSSEFDFALNEGQLQVSPLRSHRRPPVEMTGCWVQTLAGMGSQDRVRGVLSSHSPGFQFAEIRARSPKVMRGSSDCTRINSLRPKRM